ncbi:NADP-dependent methylenetetrahydromethanopterin/methylenetetrahydrofolate dehydrogenase [Tundrisphaera lichenicola]|uniref:NADP-dependent methylenetetrahydromethanopterin/methylenetetrahydrofolate dehydrogenase n=1 Tax=Tundrisphaera lichenicola TaxID=2029860 RepID=UPI003EB6D3B5
MSSDRPSILIQLDVDPQPSVFDGVVAVDAGVDHLFRHGGVKPETVRDLVYGALFTRGGSDLKRSAIFVGGSDVAAAEEVMKAVQEIFFGPFRVSVLFDANGSNTTAAAAVLAAIEGSGGSVEGVKAAVLAGTGPVGQRVARLLAGLGAEVAIGSRSLERARATAETIGKVVDSPLSAFSTSGSSELIGGLGGASIVIAAGAAGVSLLPESIRKDLPSLKVAIDLNAVPPAGIEKVKPADRDEEREGVRCWGALGVGGTKMKIHKAAIRALFESNDKVLDAEMVFAIGHELS